MRALGRRTVVGVVAGLAWMAIAVLGQAPAAQAATAAPLDCDEVLSPAIIESVEARGYVASSNPVSSPLFPFDDATGCWWGNPDSPRISYFAVGYVAADDATIAAEQERLLATGDFARDPDDPTVIRAAQEEFIDMASYIDPSWRFQAADGWWIFVLDGEPPLPEGEPVDRATAEWTDALAADLLANLAAATASVPEPTVAPEPELLPEPAGFTATTPSTLSTLPTIAEADLSALGLGTCAAGALVLVALIALPGRLVESALAAQHERWSRALSPLVRPWSRASDRAAAALARVPGWLLIGGGIVVASLFAAIIEPQLGFNAGSLRLVLSLLATFLVESLLGLLLVAWWLTRRGHPAHLRLKPASLLIVLVSALVSRLAGFDPGFVFGLVLVLVLVSLGPDDAATEAEQSIAEGVWLLVLGLLAWVGYSLAVEAGMDASGVVGLFATETLAGFTIGSLSALPLLVLPLRGMPGEAIRRRSRLAWAGAFLVAIAVFFVVVLPLPDSWGAVDTPLAVWVGMFVAYAVVAVLIWAILTYTPQRWLPRPAGDDAVGHAQDLGVDAAKDLGVDAAKDLGVDAARE